jgi:hypothetical protein
MCAMRGEPWFWNAWGELSHRLKTGETGIRHLYGTDLLGYLNQHPKSADLFNAGQRIAS